MNPKKALICGISGQDGGYLAKLLLDKGYEVHGASRDAQVNSFYNLGYLSIKNHVNLHSMSLSDFRSVLQTLNTTLPDEIYNLAGQSSVAMSFEQPVETHESISIGTLNLLEAIRFMDRPIKLYNACSSECFGETREEGANEETAMVPKSPYGVAKASAFWQVANYRDAYGVYACSGILFNHESPLRPERFVTQKIISTAFRIFNGSDEKLELGNIDISRDWGWAPEYVEAMWKMLQLDKPADFVISTGHSYSLKDFVITAFKLFGLDWKDHVSTSKKYIRPSDISFNKGDSTKAEKLLGWKASLRMKDVIEKLVIAKQEK